MIVDGINLDVKDIGWYKNGINIGEMKFSSKYNKFTRVNIFNSKEMY